MKQQQNGANRPRPNPWYAHGLAWQRSAAWIMQHPRWTMFLLLLPTIWLAHFFLTIGFDTNLGSAIPQQDPARQTFEKFQAEFGSDNISLIAIPDENMFNNQTLSMISTITDQIAANSDISQISSLTTVKAISSADDSINIRPLIPASLPLSADQLAALQAHAKTQRFITQEVLAPDAGMSAIVIKKGSSLEDERTIQAFAKQIRDIVAAANAGKQRVIFAGLAFLREAARGYLKDDLRWILPLAFLTMLALLFIFFRTWLGVLLPILIVVLSLIWSLGLIKACGRNLSIFMSMLPLMIMVLGVSDSIHIISDYRQRCQAGSDHGQALRQTFQHMFWPCLVNSITAAAGFFSLITSSSDLVRDFGLFGALGILLAVGLTFVVLLALLPADKANAPVSRLWNWLPRLGQQPIQQLSLVISRYPRLITVTTLLLSGIGIYGILGLRVESNIIRYFKADAEVRVSLEEIEAQLGGINTINIVIQPGADGINSPEFLRKIETLHSFLAKQAIVDQVASIAELLKFTNQILHNNDQNFYRLPETRGEIAQFLLLLENLGPQLHQLLNFDYSRTCLIGRVRTVGAKALSRLIEDTRQLNRTLFPAGQAEVTGSIVLYTKTSKYLIQSQVRSIFTALLVIALIITALFRSWKIGLISLIPNLFPIIIAFAAMNWLNIHLSVTTSMVASIALGLAVDNTIHFLYRFRAEFHPDQADQNRAVERSLEQAGPAMLFSTLIVVGGFLIFCLSNFNFIIYFGLIMSISMLAGLYANLVLLPLLLRYGAGRIFAEKNRP
jgi:predicted RND superfamily exporter protein